MAERETSGQSEVRYAAGELPRSYAPARWTCTLPVDVHGRVGLTLSVGLGEPVRVSFDLENARHVAETLSDVLADYERRRSHSDRSSGMPSAEGSTSDGLKA